MHTQNLYNCGNCTLTRGGHGGRMQPFIDTFDAVWTALAAHPDVTPATQIVALYLARKAADDQAETFGASFKEIRLSTHLGERTIRRALDWLHEKRIFKTAAPARGRRPAQFEMLPEPDRPKKPGQNGDSTGDRPAIFTGQNGDSTEGDRQNGDSTNGAHINERARGRAPSSTSSLNSQSLHLPSPSDDARKARLCVRDALREIAIAIGLKNGSVDAAIESYLVAGGLPTDLPGFRRFALEKQGEAKKQEAARKRAETISKKKAIPQEWSEDPLSILQIEVNAKALDKRMTQEDAENEARAFVDWALSRGEKRSDWNATWRTRCRNWWDFTGSKRGVQGARGQATGRCGSGHSKLDALREIAAESFLDGGDGQERLMVS